MSDTATIEAGDGILLDPFEFHGHTASCIAGLGGDLPNPDPHYAFHTNYVPVARGHAHFTVRFRNLRTRFGTLWLRVHMLPSEPGATAHMVTSARMQMNRLVQHGGETYVKFEAFHGATYALMGVVLDRTDAAADDLVVHLDRPFGSVEDEDLLSINEATGTVFGTKAVKTASQLISLDAPSFALPVSQPFTSAQLAEPAFKRWSDASSRTPETAWTSAYLRQSLELYGMLEKGARGLVMGELPDGLAQVCEERGVVYENVAVNGLDMRPLDGATDLRQVDPADMRSELVAFDFLCSVGVTDRFETDSLAEAFIERSMECLRPGGLAVHVVSACAARDRLRPQRGMICFDRNGIERLGLGLVSRGHDLARLKPLTMRNTAHDDLYRSVPFGLIARRARSIL